MSEPDVDLKIYADLSAYANVDLINIKAIAEKHESTPQVVGTKLGQLKNNPKIYKRLLQAGWEDLVIPH